MMVKDLYNKRIVPGVSVAIIDGEKVTKEYYGQDSWTKKHEEITSNSLYDIASLTKVVATTTLIGKLLEEKQISSIDDPIHKYLPEFKDVRVTLRHLLTHTSGIQGFIPNRDQLGQQELIDALLQLPVTNDFNKKIKYTDTGLIYCGLIIEKIYRQPVQEVLFNEVIKKLELKNTSFSPNPLKCVPTELINGKLLRGVVHDPKARILGKHCASAGLFSNLTDLVKFSQIMLEQIKIKDPPISNQFIDSLYQNFTNIRPGRSLGWDLKNSLDDNHCILFHTGFTGTFLLLDKQNKTGMVLLTNRVHPHKNNQLFLYHRENIINSFLNENIQKKI